MSLGSTLVQRVAAYNAWSQPIDKEKPYFGILDWQIKRAAASDLL